MLDFNFTLSTHNINNARSAHATETPVLQALPKTLPLLELTHHLLCDDIQLSKHCFMYTITDFIYTQ